MKYLALFIGKIVILILRIFNHSSATALPGLIALKVYPNFLREFQNQFHKGIILVSATNGKTTTTGLIAQILADQNLRVIKNTEGSNLKRGIASILLNNTNLLGKISADYAVFEVDEAALPQIIAELIPQTIVLNNLFRDQLDRYGELDQTALKWKTAITKLNSDTTLILNADDPLIACLPQIGKNSTMKVKTLYYGLSAHIKNSTDNHADSIFCPACFQKLHYEQNSYSHLGLWSCPSCHNKNPNLHTTVSKIIPNSNNQTIIITCPQKNSNPSCQEIQKEKTDCYCELQTSLLGLYNVYNVLAAYLTAIHENLDIPIMINSIQKFEPLFGRQERLKFQNKNIFILLSKNPTGFSESLKAIAPLKPKNLLLILNDQIADGTDVSWISDINFETFDFSGKTLTISGSRAYDLALRLKYEIPDFKKSQDFENQITIEHQIGKALNQSLKNLPINETLYILPTYTAMLEVRQILTGKALH